MSRILIVLDADATGCAALDAGLALAKTLDSDVRLLQVVTDEVIPLVCEAPPLVDAAAEQWRTVVQREADRLLAAATRRANEQGVVCNGTVEWGGDPAERIAHAAEHRRCDLIVVGSHQRSAISRLLRGSIASDLTAIGPVPVLVVKAPAGVEKFEPLWKSGSRGTPVRPFHPTAPKAEPRR